MLNKPLHRMQVVKREEKEVTLFRFVLEEIAAGRVGIDSEWTILALSMESPVVTAVRRVVAELAPAAQLSIRIVIVGRDATVDRSGFEGVAAFSVRQAGNLRLLDAHEQLVLGPKTSWTGDCMRRNPCERDAFEGYASDEATLADWAKKAFERIWAGANAASEDQAQVAGGLGGADAFDELVVAGEANSGTIITATSRH